MKKSFLLISLMVIFFQGCLNYIQFTEIEKNTSGNMRIHYWSKIPAPEDSLLIFRLGIFDEDSIRNHFSSDFTSIKDVQIYNDSKDTTIHAEVDLEFTSIDSINRMDAFRGYNFELKKISENTISFKQEIPPFSTGFGVADDNSVIKYIYKFPGKIIDHNADSVDNNNLIWNFNSDEIGMGKTIRATYSFGDEDSRARWVYLTILILGLIFALVYFFKRRKS